MFKFDFNDHVFVGKVRLAVFIPVTATLLAPVAFATRRETNPMGPENKRIFKLTSK